MPQNPLPVLGTHGQDDPPSVNEVRNEAPRQQTQQLPGVNAGFNELMREFSQNNVLAGIALKWKERKRELDSTVQRLGTDASGHFDILIKDLQEHIGKLSDADSAQRKQFNAFLKEYTKIADSMKNSLKDEEYSGIKEEITKTEKLLKESLSRTAIAAERAVARRSSGGSAAASLASGIGSRLASNHSSPFIGAIGGFLGNSIGSIMRNRAEARAAREREEQERLSQRLDILDRLNQESMRNQSVESESGTAADIANRGISSAQPASLETGTSPQQVPQFTQQDANASINRSSAIPNTPAAPTLAPVAEFQPPETPSGAQPGGNQEAQGETSQVEAQAESSQAHAIFKEHIENLFKTHDVTAVEDQKLILKALDNYEKTANSLSGNESILKLIREKKEYVRHMQQNVSSYKKTKKKGSYDFLENIPSKLFKNSQFLDATLGNLMRFGGKKFKNYMVARDERKESMEKTQRVLQQALAEESFKNSAPGTPAAEAADTALAGPDSPAGQNNVLQFDPTSSILSRNRALGSGDQPQEIPENVTDSEGTAGEPDTTGGLAESVGSLASQNDDLSSNISSLNTTLETTNSLLIDFIQGNREGTSEAGEEAPERVPGAPEDTIGTGPDAFTNNDTGSNEETQTGDAAPEVIGTGPDAFTNNDTGSNEETQVGNGSGTGMFGLGGFNFGLGGLGLDGGGGGGGQSQPSWLRRLLEEFGYRILGAIGTALLGILAFFRKKIKALWDRIRGKSNVDTNLDGDTDTNQDTNQDNNNENENRTNPMTGETDTDGETDTADTDIDENLDLELNDETPAQVQEPETEAHRSTPQTDLSNVPEDLRARAEQLNTLAQSNNLALEYDAERRTFIFRETQGEHAGRQVAHAGADAGSRVEMMVLDPDKMSKEQIKAEYTSKEILENTNLARRFTVEEVTEMAGDDPELQQYLPQTEAEKALYNREAKPTLRDYDFRNGENIERTPFDATPPTTAEPVAETRQNAPSALDAAVHQMNAPPPVTSPETDSSSARAIGQRAAAMNQSGQGGGNVRGAGKGWGSLFGRIAAGAFILTAGTVVVSEGVKWVATEDGKDFKNEKGELLSAQDEVTIQRFTENAERQLEKPAKSQVAPPPVAPTSGSEAWWNKMAATGHVADLMGKEDAFSKFMTDENTALVGDVFQEGAEEGMEALFSMGGKAAAARAAVPPPTPVAPRPAAGGAKGWFKGQTSRVGGIGLNMAAGAIGSIGGGVAGMHVDRAVSGMNQVTKAGGDWRSVMGFSGPKMLNEYSADEFQEFMNEEGYQLKQIKVFNDPRLKVDVGGGKLMNAYDAIKHVGDKYGIYQPDGKGGRTLSPQMREILKAIMEGVYGLQQEDYYNNQGAVFGPNMFATGGAIMGGVGVSMLLGTAAAPAMAAGFLGNELMQGFTRNEADSEAYYNNMMGGNQAYLSHRKNMGIGEFMADRVSNPAKLMASAFGVDVDSDEMAWIDAMNVTNIGENFALMKHAFLDADSDRRDQAGYDNKSFLLEQQLLNLTKSYGTFENIPDHIVEDLLEKASGGPNSGAYKVGYLNNFKFADESGKDIDAYELMKTKEGRAKIQQKMFESWNDNGLDADSTEEFFRKLNNNGMTQSGEDWLDNWERATQGENANDENNKEMRVRARTTDIIVTNTKDASHRRHVYVENLAKIYQTTEQDIMERIKKKAGGSTDVYKQMIAAEGLWLEMLIQGGFHPETHPDYFNIISNHENREKQEDFFSQLKQDNISAKDFQGMSPEERAARFNQFDIKIGASDVRDQVKKTLDDGVRNAQNELNDAKKAKEDLEAKKAELVKKQHDLVKGIIPSEFDGDKEEYGNQLSKDYNDLVASKEHAVNSRLIDAERRAKEAKQAAEDFFADPENMTLEAAEKNKKDKETEFNTKSEKLKKESETLTRMEETSLGPKIKENLKDLDVLRSKIETQSGKEKEETQKIIDKLEEENTKFQKDIDIQKGAVGSLQEDVNLLSEQLTNAIAVIDHIQKHGVEVEEGLPPLGETPTTPALTTLTTLMAPTVEVGPSSLNLPSSIVSPPTTRPQIIPRTPGGDLGNLNASLSELGLPSAPVNIVVNTNNIHKNNSNSFSTLSKFETPFNYNTARVISGN